jgi:hypothetical protein
VGVVLHRGAPESDRMKHLRGLNLCGKE